MVKKKISHMRQKKKEKEIMLDIKEDLTKILTANYKILKKLADN